VDPKVLQSLTRHKSIETLLKHYRAVEMSDKQSAIAKISGYCKSTANPDGKSTAAEKLKPHNRWGCRVSCGAPSGIRTRDPLIKSHSFN